MRNLTIPDLIQEGLARRQWSAAQLARELGVSEATVSRWIADQSVPDYEYERFLAELAQISLQDWQMLCDSRRREAAVGRLEREAKRLGRRRR